MEKKASVEKIVSDDLKGVGVVGMDDIPGLSAYDMQAKFEETARSVIIPRLNLLITAFNQLADDVDNLLLGSGNVTPSQIEYWNSKADISEESYRKLTKNCTVGGMTGWYKFGEIAVTKDLKSYEAVLLVRSTYLAGKKQNAGVLSLVLRMNSESGGVDNASSKMQWITPAGFAENAVCAAYDGENGIIELYIRTEDSAERLHVAVLSEGNGGEFVSLLTTADNSELELSAPNAAVYAGKSECVSISRYTFEDGAVADIPDGYSEWTATAEISNLTINYLADKFETWLKFTTAAAGAVTITLPESKYIGEAPVFGNGETWEVSIKDLVVIAVKCE
jgi:hypothetical protein